MMSAADVARQVEARAAGRCEYCRMHQTLQGATFHLEHIVPQSRGGLFDAANLAWACPGCNLRKSDRTEAVDSETSESVPLFNPRTEAWSEHFRFDNFTVVGLTSIGRATIAALALNQPRRLLIRQAEQLFQLFPP
jgi:hypothetical protein